jgi:hypothetical protein
VRYLSAALIAALAGCGGVEDDVLTLRADHREAGKAAQTCTGGSAVTIRSAALDNPALALTGLYVTVQQDGTTLAAGWTPFTVPDLCAGQDYAITAADYRNYRFSRWEDGNATWLRRVTVQTSAAYTAFYQVGGSIVPLYSWPAESGSGVSATWKAIADAHQRKPGLAMIPVVNNQNGPGPSPDASWTRGIDLLASAGCKVAGYVYTEYGKRSLTTVEADIANWRAWYPNVTALFLDQMSNTAGDEGYYATLASYARSRGLDLVIGNPGAPTVPSYIGTVDTMVIQEGTEVPTSFPAWQASYSPNHFATLTYALTSPLPGNQVTSNKAAVAYQYMTDDGVFPDWNPWDEASIHFDALLDLLDG